MYVVLKEIKGRSVCKGVRGPLHFSLFCNIYFSLFVGRNKSTLQKEAKNVSWIFRGDLVG